MNTTQLKQIFRVQLVVGTLVFLLLMLTIFISSVVASPSSTQSVAQSDSTEHLWGLGLGAGIAIGLAGLGAGLGLGSASSAAIGAITERPEVFGRTIILSYIGSTIMESAFSIRQYSSKFLSLP